MAHTNPWQGLQTLARGCRHRCLNCHQNQRWASAPHVVDTVTGVRPAADVATSAVISVAVEDGAVGEETAEEAIAGMIVADTAVNGATGSHPRRPTLTPAQDLHNRLSKISHLKIRTYLRRRSVRALTPSPRPRQINGPRLDRHMCRHRLRCLISTDNRVQEASSTNPLLRRPSTSTTKPGNKTRRMLTRLTASSKPFPQRLHRSSSRRRMLIVRRCRRRRGLRLALRLRLREHTSTRRSSGAHSRVRRPKLRSRRLSRGIGDSLPTEGTGRAPNEEWCHWAGGRGVRP